MKLSEIGEFGFIERFAHRFEDLLTPNAMGIGDDCAVIPTDDNHDWVITTDMLVEDVHFLRDKISPIDLGHKALAVNLSDIAAMGAKPVGSFLSIAIPNTIEVEYLDALMDGYHKLSEKYNLPLMGGDTTRSPFKLVLNISVIGRVAKGKAKLRSMASDGDIIAVTGELGNSAAGFQIISKSLPINNHSKYLIDCHNQPRAHIEEGLWLAQQPGVNAMMDVSDGIASDLKHILKASKKGAHVELSNLPISKQLINVAQQNQLNAIDLATSGGEDYCLLVTIASSKFEKIKESFNSCFNQKLTPIGIINNKTDIKYTKHGLDVAELKSGFNHFG